MIGVDDEERLRTHERRAGDPVGSHRLATRAEVRALIDEADRRFGLAGRPEEWRGVSWVRDRMKGAAGD